MKSKKLGMWLTLVLFLMVTPLAKSSDVDAVTKCFDQARGKGPLDLDIRSSQVAATLCLEVSDQYEVEAVIGCYRKHYEKAGIAAASLCSKVKK